MRECGGGMFADRECHQKEHFHALREVAVEVGGDLIEAVVLQVSGRKSEVIEGSVGADFRGEGVDEIEGGEGGKRDEPDGRLL